MVLSDCCVIESLILSSFVPLFHATGRGSTVLQCSRLWNDDDDDDDSVSDDSDAAFDAALRSTSDVIDDVTTADAGGTEEDKVLSADQVISELESMLEVRTVHDVQSIGRSAAKRYWTDTACWQRAKPRLVATQIVQLFVQRGFCDAIRAVHKPTPALTSHRKLSSKATGA